MTQKLEEMKWISSEDKKGLVLHNTIHEGVSNSLKYSQNNKSAL